MTDAFVHAVVYGTTAKARRIWDDLQPFEREHLVQTVAKAPKLFDVPGQTIPKKSTETWGYFNLPTTPSATPGTFFTIPGDADSHG